MAAGFDPKKYWDERLSQHYNLIGVGDISLTMSYNRWSYKVTKHRLQSLFKKYVTEKTRRKVYLILDQETVL